jgi:hypothetical protein
MARQESVCEVEDNLTQRNLAFTKRIAEKGKEGIPVPVSLGPDAGQGQ